MVIVPLAIVFFAYSLLLVDFCILFSDTKFSRSSNLPLPSLSDSEDSESRSHHQVKVCHTEMKTDPDWRASAYYAEGESLSFQYKYS